jgi:hypothetical protein
MKNVPFERTVDEFSHQVWTSSDNRFWFRLVREGDRDVVTDYLIGGFSRQEAGALLVGCYAFLGLVPQSLVVFTNIAPAATSEAPEILDQARELYEAAGRTLLSEFGANAIETQVEWRDGKCNVLVWGAF